jgi:hypothetical protein
MAANCDNDVKGSGARVKSAKIKRKMERQVRKINDRDQATARAIPGASSDSQTQRPFDSSCSAMR